MRNLDKQFELTRKSKLFDKLNIDKTKAEVLEKLINLEWIEFDKVNKNKDRAFCQDESNTFFVMRFSQHACFSVETLESLLFDYKKTIARGYNPVEDKYIRMMEKTDPSAFEIFKDKLTFTSDVKHEKIKTIISELEKDYKIFLDKNPISKEHSRPFETRGKNVSALIYLEGELYSYSLKTLNKIYKEIKNRKSNLIDIIYFNMTYISQQIPQIL